MHRPAPSLVSPDHDCQTAGLAGLKNGWLLDAAEAAGFEVLVTVDRNIPGRQNLTGRTISLLQEIAEPSLCRKGEEESSGESRHARPSSMARKR